MGKGLVNENSRLKAELQLVLEKNRRIQEDFNLLREQASFNMQVQAYLWELLIENKIVPEQDLEKTMEKMTKRLEVIHAKRDGKE